MKVQIIMPSGALGGSADEDAIDTAMRVIGNAFAQDGEWATKYGTDVNNDVFMMKTYCWCELEGCKWCEGEAPNFLFKPTGFRLRWYKYIGRGMEAQGQLPSDFLAQVLATHPDKPTVDRALADYARRADETAAVFSKMFASLGIVPTGALSEGQGESSAHSTEGDVSLHDPTGPTYAVGRLVR